MMIANSLGSQSRGHGGAVVTDSPPTSEAGSSYPGHYVGKVGSLTLVGSLQYRTLTNCMYWIRLPIKLSVVI